MNLLDKFVEKYGRLPTEFDPDYLEMLRMSKYRVMPVPDQQPGKCANCGASKPDGRSYADFGLLIPWYGTVFLCSICITDIARNVGSFKSIEGDLKFAQEHAIATQNLWDLGKELENKINEAFEGVKEYFDRLRSLGDGLPPHTGLSVESDKESSKQAAGEGNRASDVAKSGATKSTPSSRPKDLLSLAERLQASNTK